MAEGVGDNDYCEGHYYDDDCDDYDYHNDDDADYNDDADNCDHHERSPPALVEPWLRGTLRPAGKQTGPAAAAANIQCLGIFHFLCVFYICQTFNILHFFMFCNNDNNEKKT